MLMKDHGGEVMSQVTFYKWFKQFYEGQEQVKDEDISRAPKCAHMVENIEEVCKLVITDYHSTMSVIPEAVGISIDAVNTVLNDDLHLHKICTKFMPKILFETQLEVSLEVCMEILKMIETD